MSSPIDRRRFVVLRHTDRDGVHYDLMIENGERLATWKLTRPPEEATRETLAANRIDEHRRVYLDYEGPISGDRGHVTRHDEGTCEVREDKTPDGAVNRLRLQVSGEKLSGRLELVRDPENQSRWSLRCLPV